MDENIKVPSGSKYLEQKTTDAKQRVGVTFEEYKTLLSDRTHPDNQTSAYKNNIISTLNRLLTAADRLDDEKPGEGIFGLIVLSLRSILKVKDENVKLEVKIRELEKQIKKLEKSR